MNMAVSGRTSLRMSILNHLLEDLKVIFLAETNCEICFIDIREIQLQKKKSEVKNGVRRLMEKSILNCHFDYWNASLSIMGD